MSNSRFLYLPVTWILLSMVNSALIAQPLPADSLHYTEGLIWATRSQALVENTKGNLDKQMDLTMYAEEQRAHLATIREQRVLVAVCSFLLAILIPVAVLLYRLYKRQQELSRQLNSRNAEVSQQNRIILEQNAELGSLNQVKDKIFSVISHDLRSPLAILEGMLFLLRDNKLERRQFQEFTGELWRDMKNTAYMMDNLLNWASSQMKGIRVKADDFEITSIFNREFELLQTLSRQKEVHLTHQILKPVIVYADPDMIKVVLRNLISNAIKFTPAGNSIHISGQIKGAFLEICVQDNGIGIPEKDQHKIFSNIYYSTSGTQNEKGCGLGLPLSKDFVTLNQGCIWFNSQPGKGTSFFFTIPLSEEDTNLQGYTIVVQEQMN